MIVDITNEILTKIKTSIPDVTVISAYEDVKPTFPLITISEIDNSNDPFTRDSSGYNHCNCAIEINIYTNSENKELEAKEIRNKIDNICSDEYGMNRDTATSIPNFIDRKVYRYLLRYSYKIDRNKKIYRR